MSKNPITDSIRKQTRRQTNTEFNNLIGTILSELPSQSPQYTGFFASSWQANTYRPLANEADTISVVRNKKTKTSRTKSRC